MLLIWSGDWTGIDGARVSVGVSVYVCFGQLSYFLNCTAARWQPCHLCFISGYFQTVLTLTRALFSAPLLEMPLRQSEPQHSANAICSLLPHACAVVNRTSFSLKRPPQ